VNFKTPVVILDIESTGTWIEKDKVIEIAMIKIHSNQERETYNQRVNPGIPIPKVVSELTGITDEDVRNAPAFKDIAVQILNFIGDCELGGFNVERFDLPLLDREFTEAGHKLDWQKRGIYDVQKIYHIHEKRDLTTAYKFYCSKELINAHSALADTQATLEILECQAAKYGEDDLESLKKFTYEVRQEFYGTERKFRWWNGKLYMMFGKYAKQYSLQEIVKKDRGYLEWILSADFSDEVKELVQSALGGKLPMIDKKGQQELF
jgi:DNA polymerase-3 subunit epsilon